jgi:hypothetical protein
MEVPVRLATRDVAWTPESAAYASRAAELGLTFVPRVEPGGGFVPAEAVRRGSVAWCRDGTLAIAPEADKIPDIAAWLARHPTLAHRLRVAAPSEIRRALTAANARGFADAAISNLDRRFPTFSARRAFRPVQAAVLAAIVAGAAYSIATDPFRAVAEIGVVATFFFLAVSVFRFAAAAALRKKGPHKPVPVSDAVPDDALPIYTILVPLYREAAVVRSLIAALRRIDWPGIR